MGDKNELICEPNHMISVVSETTLGELIKPLKKEVLLFQTYIAGTTRLDDSIITGLKSGDKLKLLRNPENVFDRNAITVLDSSNRAIGYIPEKDNTVFARLMDAGKYLFARITSFEQRRPFTRVIINIYLVDF